MYLWRKIIFTSIAQTDRSYLGFGGLSNTFQDSRRLDLQVSGSLFCLEYGYERVTDKKFWIMNLNRYLYSINHPNMNNNMIATFVCSTGPNIIPDLDDTKGNIIYTYTNLGG